MYLDGFGVHRVPGLSACPLPVEKAGVEQGTQVMGDGRLGESHLIGQDAGGRPSVVRGSDQAQQPQPRGVGQHLQRPGQGQRIAGLQGGLQDR